MKIPKKINLLGEEWEIKIVDKLGKDTGGKIYYWSNEIELLKQTQKEMEHCLWHEIAHIFDNRLGFQNGERVARPLGIFLRQIYNLK